MKVWKAFSFMFLKKNKKKKADTKKMLTKERNNTADEKVENIKTDQSKIFHAREFDENFRCRICLDLGDDPDQEICAPCECTGSIKFSHVKCLKAWIKEKKSVQCEICHKPYKNKWKMWAVENDILKTKKAATGGSTFHNNHLIIKLLSVLHLIYWTVFIVGMILNSNNSLKSLKESHYYYLISFNKIFFLLLMIATIVCSVFWSCIFKNFEFYCDAFQRQLRGGMEYEESSQEDRGRGYNSHSNENPSVTINYNN